MNQLIFLREFQKTDRPALEQIIRETWNYDRFIVIGNPLK